MISPTIGRRVWFWPNLKDHKSPIQVLDTKQPCDAGVVFVVDDRTVHLSVTDHLGTTHALKHVKLLQEGDPRPGTDSAFAEWMPYQTAQAKKAEEKGLSKDVLELEKATAVAREAALEEKVRSFIATGDKAPAPIPPPPVSFPDVSK